MSSFLGSLYLAGFAWRPAAKNYYLGGKLIFFGGFWPPMQFAILVLPPTGRQVVVLAGGIALGFV